MYFFIHRRYIFMSHAFNKKGSQVPQKEIAKAIDNRRKVREAIGRGELKFE
ncbi:type II toxin-antitoxin system RelE/ParE family toxin [bacterium]|nr:type II toxin-antitoxin system RelE/ParE family toxin [bacterium]